MPNENNVNTGNSGEYFVAGELERRSFTVAVPMSNVENFDILAIHKKTYKQFAIQVKTTSHKSKKWTLTAKNENLIGDNIIYVFVALNKLEAPSFHIVPSAIVAKEVKESHQNWLKTPRRDGKSHRDNNLRNFRDDKDIYLNRWDFFD